MFSKIAIAYAYNMSIRMQAFKHHDAFKHAHMHTNNVTSSHYVNNLKKNTLSRVEAHASVADVAVSVHCRYPASS